MSDVGADSDEEDQQQPNGRPYNELLELLNADPAPARKKRKLGHDSREEDVEAVTEEVPESTDMDVLERQEASEDEDAGSDRGESDSDEEDGKLNYWLDFTMALYTDKTQESDPFETHFARPDETVLSRKVALVSEDKWRQIKKPLTDGTRLTCGIPNTEDEDGALPPAVRSTGKLKVRCHV